MFFWCFGAFRKYFLNAAGKLLGKVLKLSKSAFRPGLTCSVFSVWCWWCLNALYTTFECWRAWRCSFSPASRLSLLLCGKEERTCEALASIPPIHHAKHIAYREHSTMHSSTTQSIPAAQQKPYPRCSFFPRPPVKLCSVPGEWYCVGVLVALEVCWWLDLLCFALGMLPLKLMVWW